MSAQNDVSRYATVVSSVVINVSLWDGISPWTPSEGKAVLIPDGEPVAPGWSYVKGKFAPPKVGPTEPPTRLEQQEARRLRYQLETDGLFFSAQRDGLPLDEWKAAVAAIKADLPYPEERS